MLEIDVDSGEKVILNLVKLVNLVILSQFLTGLQIYRIYKITFLINRSGFLTEGGAIGSGVSSGGVR